VRHAIGNGVHRCGSHRVGDALQQIRALAQQSVGAVAGHRLDAARARSDAPVAGDDEAADLAGGRAVRAAAQFERVAFDADGPDLLAVLLVEECVGAGGDRLGHRLDHGRHRPVLANDPPNLVLDGAFLGGKVSGRSSG
jgi:hypothetical protein